MGVWNKENSVITNKGLEVLAKVQAGIGKLVVDSVVTGAGQVSFSDLRIQTEVSDPKQTMDIVSKTVKENGSIIDVKVSNTGIEEPYKIYQVGVYVTHEDFEGKVLYLIMQATEPDDVPLPSVTPTTVNYSLYLKHENTSNISIEVTQTGLVTSEEFEEHVDNTKNPHKVSTEQINAVNKNQVGVPKGIASLGENGAVPVLQGGTGTTTAQAALSALGAGVRPNLLDNAIFVGGGTGGKLPINQRGQTEYTGQVSTIDRWSMIGTTGKLTLNSNGVYFEKVVDATSYAGLDEKIPLGNLEGKELTLSCLVDGVCYCVTVSAGWSSDLSKTIQIVTDGKYMTLSVVRVDDTLLIRFYYGGAASVSNTGFLLQAVKLEIGSIQTLAYQDIDDTWKLLPQPESDYATQLMKCKYYATIIGNGYPVRLQADYITENSMYFTLPVDVPMRNVNPTIVSSDLLNIYSGSTQTGFSFFAYNAGNCLIIGAGKQNHGLSSAMLQMQNVLLSCEL